VSLGGCSCRRDLKGVLSFVWTGLRGPVVWVGSNGGVTVNVGRTNGAPASAVLLVMQTAENLP
jgi:hypothetical protein